MARSFISIPAGVFGMPFRRYNVLTLFGNALWCFAIAGIGWGLGSSYERFNHGFRYAEYAVVIAIVAGAAYLVLLRRRKATMGAR